ncbi:MAG TPA: lipid II flippase MurJ [Polyangiaceae bacterium]
MTAPPAGARSPPPSMARTALALLPLQALFRGSEALLPLLLAAWFGRTVETDLYYLLASYFVFAASIITGLYQDSGAVAVLVDVEARSPALLPEVAGSLLGHTLAIGAASAFGLGAVAALVAASTSRLPYLALELVALMSVGTFAIAVRSFYVGLANARGAFTAHPIASGVGMGLTWVVLFVGRGALGVRSVPLAMLSGELLAIAILASTTRRRLGARLVPTLARSEPVRRIFRLTRLEVAGSLTTRINPVIDQLMAGLTGVVGGGTLVRYAADVASLPTSILQAVLFPVLLRRLALESREPARFLATTRRTVGTVVAAVAVFALAFGLVRAPLCRLLFLRGAMDAAGVARIAAILPWALAGAAPFGALLVLARAHVARQNSRIMPGMGVLNAGLNAGFNALLVGPMGLSGLALSTSLTYAVVAVVFWVRLPRDAPA